jgi:hypothetical protein
MNSAVKSSASDSRADVPENGIRFATFLGFDDDDDDTDDDELSAVGGDAVGDGFQVLML